MAVAQESDIAFWQKYTELSQNIIKRFHCSNITVDKQCETAIRMFHKRIVSSIDSLLLLAAKGEHDISWGSAMVMRGLYEAVLQAIFILHKPNIRAERARLYLEFYWVEKYRFISLVDRNKTDIAKRLANSSFRAAGEPKILAEYQRVKSKYATKKGKPRDYWYVGNMRDIAKDIGYEDEYELMQRELSRSVHSSPWSLNHGCSISGTHLLTMAWHLLMRFLAVVTEFLEIELTTDEDELTRNGKENLFEMGGANSDARN